MTTWLHGLMPHLIAAPVLVPLLAAALTLLPGDDSSHRRWQAGVGLVATVINLVVAIALMTWTRSSVAPAQGPS